MLFGLWNSAIVFSVCEHIYFLDSLGIYVFKLCPSHYSP